MADLIENMALLNVMVPAVPEQIAPVASSGAEAIAAAKRLIEDAGDKRDEAKQLLQQVTAALTAFRDGAHEDRQRLQQALGVAQGALQAAVAAFEEGEQDVRVAAEGAGNALDQLQQGLVRAAERGTAAQEGLSEKAEAVASGFESAQSDLDSAVDTAAGTAGKIEKAISNGRDAIQSAADELLEEVAPVPDAIESLLGDSTQRLATELTTMQGEVGAALDDLAARGDGAAEALREGLAEQREPLDEAVTDAQNGLAALGETAVTPIEDLAGSRGDAASGTGNLEPQMTALEAGVDNLRQAAATAGIEWPNLPL